MGNPYIKRAKKFVKQKIPKSWKPTAQQIKKEIGINNAKVETAKPYIDNLSPLAAVLLGSTAFLAKLAHDTSPYWYVEEGRISFEDAVEKYNNSELVEVGMVPLVGTTQTSKLEDTYFEIEDETVGVGYHLGEPHDYKTCNNDGVARAINPENLLYPQPLPEEFERYNTCLIISARDDPIGEEHNIRTSIYLSLEAHDESITNAIKEKLKDHDVSLERDRFEERRSTYQISFGAGVNRNTHVFSEENFTQFWNDIGDILESAGIDNFEMKKTPLIPIEILDSLRVVKYKDMPLSTTLEGKLNDGSFLNSVFPTPGNHRNHFPYSADYNVSANTEEGDFENWVETHNLDTSDSLPYILEGIADYIADRFDYVAEDREFVCQHYAVSFVQLFEDLRGMNPNLRYASAQYMGHEMASGDIRHAVAAVYSTDGRDLHVSYVDPTWRDVSRSERVRDDNFDALDDEHFVYELGYSE